MALSGASPRGRTGRALLCFGEAITETMHPLTRFIRWVAALPFACICFYLAWLAVFYGNQLSAWLTGYDPSAPLSWFMANFLSHAAASCAFIWAACWMSPTQNQQVPVIWGTVGCVVILFCGVICVIQRAWWDVAWSIVGAVAMFQTAQAEHDKRAMESVQQKIMGSIKRGEGYPLPEDYSPPIEEPMRRE